VSHQFRRCIFMCLRLAVSNRHSIRFDSLSFLAPATVGFHAV